MYKRLNVGGEDLTRLIFFQGPDDIGFRLIPHNSYSHLALVRISDRSRRCIRALSIRQHPHSMFYNVLVKDSWGGLTTPPYVHMAEAVRPAPSIF